MMYNFPCRRRSPILYGLSCLLTALLPTQRLGAQPVALNTVPLGSYVIDFNALSTTTPITNQFAAVGLTVSGGLCANSFYRNAMFGGDLMQASNFLNGPVCTAPNAPYPAVTFTFAQPIDYFGLLGGANGLADGLRFTTERGSVLTPPLMPNVAFVGIEDQLPFTAVTVSATGNGAFTMDNLTYRPVTTVPEPASALLTALGLCSLAVSASGRWRRR